MGCYHPLKAYQTGTTINGKKIVSFKEERDEHKYPQIAIPCGKCIGCKLDKAKQWAIRCIHEASLYEQNCFITLTFNEEYLPEDHSIDKRHLQLFFKKLRNRITDGRTIKYFACGEYGEQRNRPHYHALIFNYDFPDKRLWKKTEAGELIYRSEILEKLWPYGYSSIGNVTFESAGYVARYQFKKQKDKKSYELVDDETGELFNLEPEFLLMSRGGKKGHGIGYEWFKKYHEDTNKDYLTVNRMKVGVPKYYDYLKEQTMPQLLEEIKAQREQNILDKHEEFTKERLEQKEAVKKHQLSQLKRGIE
jgi:hypothetical protein